MLDLNMLGEFSRNHCIAICAFLVPANMFATIQTMIFTALRHPTNLMVGIVAASVVYALAMVFHVFSWFAIGVVMVPTFILLFLATVCLAINLWAIAFPENMARILQAISRAVINRLPALHLVQGKN